jgi:hypothetical protein
MQLNSITALITVFFASLAVNSPAWALFSNTYPSMSGPQLAAILKSKGYQSELVADNYGDPMINSSTEGYHFSIFFWGCDKAAIRACAAIQFQATFVNDKSYAPADANKCNNDYPLGRMRVNDKSVIIDYSIPIANIGDDYVINSFDTWSGLLANFQKCLLAQRQ